MEQKGSSFLYPADPLTQADIVGSHAEDLKNVVPLTEEELGMVLTYENKLLEIVDKIPSAEPELFILFANDLGAEGKRLLTLISNRDLTQKISKAIDQYIDRTFENRPAVEQLTERNRLYNLVWQDFSSIVNAEDNSRGVFELKRITEAIGESLIVEDSNEILGADEMSVEDMQDTLSRLHSLDDIPRPFRENMRSFSVERMKLSIVKQLVENQTADNPEAVGAVVNVEDFLNRIKALRRAKRALRNEKIQLKKGNNDEKIDTAKITLVNLYSRYISVEIAKLYPYIPMLQNSSSDLVEECVKAIRGTQATHSQRIRFDYETSNPEETDVTQHLLVRTLQRIAGVIFGTSQEQNLFTGLFEPFTADVLEQAKSLSPPEKSEEEQFYETIRVTPSQNFKLAQIALRLSGMNTGDYAWWVRQMSRTGSAVVFKQQDEFRREYQTPLNFSAGTLGLITALKTVEHELAHANRYFNNETLLDPRLKIINLLGSQAVDVTLSEGNSMGAESVFVQEAVGRTVTAVPYHTLVLENKRDNLTFVENAIEIMRLKFRREKRKNLDEVIEGWKSALQQGSTLGELPDINIAKTAISIVLRIYSEGYPLNDRSPFIPNPKQISYLRGMMVFEKLARYEVQSVMAVAGLDLLTAIPLIQAGFVKIEPDGLPNREVVRLKMWPEIKEIIDQHRDKPSTDLVDIIIDDLSDRFGIEFDKNEKIKPAEGN